MQDSLKHNFLQNTHHMRICHRSHSHGENNGHLIITTKTTNYLMHIAYM